MGCNQSAGQSRGAGPAVEQANVTTKENIVSDSDLPLNIYTKYTLTGEMNE